MNQLSALFDLPKMTIEHMIRIMEGRVGEKCKCTVENLPPAGKTRVTGPAQQVMFVIGEVAAHGEDGLMRVDRV